MTRWRRQHDARGDLWTRVDWPWMVLLRKAADGWRGATVQCVEVRKVSWSEPFADLADAKKWGTAELLARAEAA